MLSSGTIREFMGEVKQFNENLEEIAEQLDEQNQHLEEIADGLEDRVTQEALGRNMELARDPDTGRNRQK